MLSKVKKVKTMLSKNKYCFIPIKCIYKYIFNSRINNTVKIRIESGQFL